MSDSAGLVAIPHTTVETSELLNTVLALIEIDSVEALVVGESRNLDGSFNPIDAEIKQFVAELQQVATIPVDYVDERFTSTAARVGVFSTIRREKKDSRSKKIKHHDVDAAAAAMILQSFLDHKDSRI